MVVDAPPAAGRKQQQIAYLDRLLPHVLLHRALARSVECLLVSDVALPAPVLDLGCGDGTFARALSDAPLTVGIDLDRGILRWASRHDAHRSLVAASGVSLPFRSEAFASVVCNSTLEHIPEQQAVLEETNRVLAPLGTFILTIPSEHFLPYHLGAALGRFLRVPALARAYERWISYVAEVYHCDPPHIWEERLTQAGFLVRSWRYYFPAASTRAMDAAQYLSTPSFLTRWLLRRWIVWPGKGRYLPLARWLARLAEEGEGDEGAFLYFHCQKRERVA
ncbi:MAG: class I SAM-dependent methyltransferase [Chloroflexi bacterium]|nr:class I SAM-dependent methyltransferase [Chloroflexota bacterium]